MESRTIATHGGGDLVIGGEPPIEGLIHGWVYEEGARFSGPYGFMIEVGPCRELAEALRAREARAIRIYAGELRLGHTNGLAHLWFHNRGEDEPERCCRLYEGAIEAAAEAFVEACDELAATEVAIWRRARRQYRPLRAAA